MMKISEIAQQTGCSIQTIRYYEKEGLLPKPSRSEGNFRLYDLRHYEQLLFIKRCRSLDLTLNEIRQLQNVKSQPSNLCNDVNKIIDEHLAEVESGLVELKELHHQLKELRSCCSETRKVQNCDILQELSQSLSEQSKKRL